MQIIESNANRSENERRHCRGDLYPCLICGRPIAKPKYSLHLWYGSMAVTEEEAAALVAKEGDGGDTGFYPVGSDCLKKHPELRPYVA